MMYETIYTALKEVGLENTYEPQDYLNFFCLGNREVPEVNNSSRNVETSPQVTPSFYSYQKLTVHVADYIFLFTTLQAWFYLMALSGKSSEFDVLA